MDRNSVTLNQQSSSQNRWLEDPFLVGELIIHQQHGLGRYQGLRSRTDPRTGLRQEFLEIEYADNGLLCVPPTQIHLLSPYSFSGAKKSELHTLGASKWKKSYQSAKKAALGYAKQLLEEEALRQTALGFACPPDSSLTKSFEADCPFELTKDQAEAILAIKRDMEAPRAMDRIVCGDVGVGKTEVAFRAAFKAAIDGKKQVAILAPTTLLAIQHYETLLARLGCERCDALPLSIRLLCRLQKKQEVDDILQGLASGKIHIVVGTHKMLSKQVQFKDLGLVIIDEEQRFGVRHKEHLRNFRTDVDLLLLSATPIPRTLHLALMGARPLSLIQTAPPGRKRVESHVRPKSKELLRSIISQELARNGQIYVIHNRIETLGAIEKEISELGLTLKIAIAHGKMSAESLDKIFFDFKKGHYNLLISTTLIEHGIDIGNANTIIVDGAENFGLSDLYQMRGRVGRRTEQAFAYFLISRQKEISEIAQRRLEALLEESVSGKAGFGIAKRDLEFRGAGDLFGTDQSGHFMTVGASLYYKMVRNATDALKQREPAATILIDSDLPAFIPSDYIKNHRERIEIYQELSALSNKQELDFFCAALEARFGALPAETKWLCALAQLKWTPQLQEWTHITAHALTIEGKKGGVTQKIVLASSPPANAQLWLDLLFQKLARMPKRAL